ncbi:hypothetical protein FIBSPDRAFT_1041650 [Athelia psychrophila]|uniref:Nephrocystin 3-like N-terminal domain-containing protein n=1 Tax=Athelia psychrophila TaxID=1759441 RepID=A0A166NMK0_9AGAM|nr:hypothetical protein FIBSPDRAFT_1041650 [Fibularhizoctonia sp. CBS 109695]
MAASSDTSAAKSYEVTTVEATGLTPVRFKLGRFFTTHVQIDAGNLSWTTPGVKWRKDGTMRWDDKIVIPPSAGSTKVTFSLFRDTTLIGRAEIDLSGAPAKSNEDAVLSLQHKDKETGKLTVRVAESSTTALSNVMDRLEDVTANLTAPAPALTAVADITSATGDAVTSIVQSDLVGSLTSLLGSIDILLTLGDAIAKVHPWAGLAWSVLSVGLKLVKAQQDRNEKITTLIETMQALYLIVAGADNLADERIQNVLERVLKQTVICAFFVQEYARRGSFAGKALTEFLSSTDALVAGYQATFAKLRDEFTGRIATQTALNIDSIATTVNDIRSDQLLDKLRPAAMDKSKRDVCLPKTRQDVIEMIMDWYSDGSEGRESALWLYGLAGAGKSTLSNTIARMMGRADGVNLLGAFFFFDRNVTEANASTVIRTIAYQLAQFDPTIGAKIEQTIKAFPDIASEPLTVQFSKLLSNTALGDVPWSRGPVLVIIDALDESGSEAGRQDLMRTLSEGVSQLPSFLRLLIVSRRERDILEQFKHSPIRREELRIDTKTGQEDIDAFIRSRLREIREANIDYMGEALKDWPDEGEIHTLGGLASGHFIWAATACRMIAVSGDPRKAMSALLEHQPADSSANSFASLHKLYKTALGPSEVWADPSFCTNFRSILGVIVCAQVPLSCMTIDSVLASRLQPAERRLPSLQTVSRFGSVIDWSTTGPIRILHASFHDYLTAHGQGEPWEIDVEQCQVQLAYGCIALLEELRENMCNLVLPLPVPENPSLSEGISYASKFWVEHVCSITNVPDGLAEVIYHFLQEHLLHWMEALGIMKAHGVAIHSLSRLLQWTQKHCAQSDLYHFVHDAHRFAQYFSSTIEKHPLLIYTSAIPFTPHDTLIYKTFHHNKLPHVVSG